MVADTKVSFTYEFTPNNNNKTNIKNATLSNQSKLKNNLCIESVVKPLHNSDDKNVKYITFKSSLNSKKQKSNKEPSLITSTPKIASNYDIISQEVSEKMKNDAVSIDETTRSFLERFFDREINSNSSKANSLVNETEAAVEKTNEQEKENINIKVDENANVNSKIETNDEIRNEFLEFLFESKPSLSSSRNSVASKIESRDKYKKKPNSDIDGILIYLSNLKPKNKLNSKIVKNYLDLQKTLSDSVIRHYITKRLDCKCVQNALGCCLEAFYALNQNNSNLNDFFDICCQKCSNFEFYDYRLSDDSSSNVSESNKFETEEPDWYKNLKNLGSNNSISEILYVHNSLRTPNVHEFISRSKCKCLQHSTNCCIKRIYELLDGKTDDIKYLKEFIEYSCCAQCQTEEEAVKRHLGADLARSIFATKLNSNSSSLDENDPDTALNANNQSNSQSKMVEMSVSHEKKNEEANENESYSKSQTKNKSNTDEINKSETGGDQTKDLDHQNINEVVSEEKNINQSNQKIESKETTASIEPNVEEASPIETSTHEKSKIQNEKTRESLNLVTSKTLPTVSSKSLLKMNNSRTRTSNSSVKKSKNVTFYDEKHGFICVPIAQWQEDLREPVYSKSKISAAEWKTEVVKNEYEETKLRLSMSLNS